MSKLKKYISDTSLAFQGLMLLCIDRAKGKELDLDYVDEFKNQITMYRNLTGRTMISEEVIVIAALKMYNNFVAYGLSEEDARDIMQKYVKGDIK